VQLKKKKKTQQPKIKIHQDLHCRSPPLSKIQQPSNRDSHSSFTTATQTNSDEGERGERGLMHGFAVASGWPRLAPSSLKRRQTRLDSPGFSLSLSLSLSLSKLSQLKSCNSLNPTPQKTVENKH
jgi:hypothetical protein